LRTVYRQPLVETVLAAAVLFQVTTGIILLRRRPVTSNPFEITQGIAGAYLAGFLASHISAVVRARYLSHVDTNWLWLTSSNLLTDQWSARLVPYYFLGIVALGIHGSCGLRHVLVKHGRVSFARIAFWVFTIGTFFVALAAITGLVRGSLHD
jgi:succinate dehydrogenase/fumarate reductase cytochrome b subunit